jgi:hypothetical protein
MRFVAIFDPYFAARGCAPFVWLSPREREATIRAEAEEKARENSPAERSVVAPLGPCGTEKP